MTTIGYARVSTVDQDLELLEDLGMKAMQRA